MRLLLLLAGANPEKQAGWLLEIGAGCWRLGLAESRSHIHQRPTQRIACYSLISTEGRARTYTPPQIEKGRQADERGGREGGMTAGHAEGHEKRIRKTLLQEMEREEAEIMGLAEV
ncbi:hypothetical protein CgunFtcFv8_006473 [Champsocephalus gunnari]|uniref:Uncharacterized protein n=1 Tax=Champsocephalus gunnari TaxID=52237 RepID=A0AAN8GW40_CHAGU|nr:hypothetical protein CgunFtcFv8_006473 [Champsocephalus gunnari]